MAMEREMSLPGLSRASVAAQSNPLDRLTAEHALQLELCDALELIADSLPARVPKTLLHHVTAVLSNGMDSHFSFEEDVLFPLLRQRGGGEASLSAALDQLESEHARDAGLCDELVEELSALLWRDEPRNVEMLAYMLRRILRRPAPPHRMGEHDRTPCGASSAERAATLKRSRERGSASAGSLAKFHSTSDRLSRLVGSRAISGSQSLISSATAASFRVSGTLIVRVPSTAMMPLRFSDGDLPAHRFDRQAQIVGDLAARQRQLESARNPIPCRPRTPSAGIVARP